MIRPAQPDFGPRRTAYRRILSPEKSGSRHPQSPGIDPGDTTDGGGICPFLPQISAFHDGELPRDDAIRVCGHLESCQTCFNLLAFLERVTATFAAADPSKAAVPHRRPERLHMPHEEKRLPPADVRWARRLAAVASILFLAAVGRSFYVHYNAGSGGAGIGADPLHQAVDLVLPRRSSPGPSTSRPAGD